MIVSLGETCNHIRCRQSKKKKKKRNCCFSFSVPCLCLHSCSLNTYTKVLTNGNSSTSRVSVQIFSIVNMNVIYLHCQVQICAQIGSDSCVPVGISQQKNHIPPCFYRVNESEVTNSDWKSCLNVEEEIGFFSLVIFVCFLGLSTKNSSVFTQHNWNCFRFFRPSAEVRWR